MANLSYRGRDTSHSVVLLRKSLVLMSQIGRRVSGRTGGINASRMKWMPSRFAVLPLCRLLYSAELYVIFLETNCTASGFCQMEFSVAGLDIFRGFEWAFSSDFLIIFYSFSPLSIWISNRSSIESDHKSCSKQTVHVTLDGNPFNPPEAVQKCFCRFITHLLFGTEPIYSSIFVPGNILF